MAGKPGHGGQKGRSGRRPLLADSKIEEILELSHSILFRWLGNDKVDIAKKIPVVSQLIGKRVPNKIEAEGFVPEGNKIIIVYPQGHKQEGDNGRVKVQSEALPSEVL